MNSTLSRLKAWQQRQAIAAYRTRNQRRYIFAWLMAASAVRITFFRYETFWPNTSSTIIALLIGDFIGSRTFDLFARFVQNIRGVRSFKSDRTSR
jgi:hypothetical protein